MLSKGALPDLWGDYETPSECQALGHAVWLRHGPRPQGLQGHTGGLPPRSTHRPAGHPAHPISGPEKPAGRRKHPWGGLGTSCLAEQKSHLGASPHIPCGSTHCGMHTPGVHSQDQRWNPGICILNRHPERTWTRQQVDIDILRNRDDLTLTSSGFTA